MHIKMAWCGRAGFGREEFLTRAQGERSLQQSAKQWYPENEGSGGVVDEGKVSALLGVTLLPGATKGAKLYLSEVFDVLVSFDSERPPLGRASKRLAFKWMQ